MRKKAEKRPMSPASVDSKITTTTTKYGVMKGTLKRKRKGARKGACRFGSAVDRNQIKVEITSNAKSNPSDIVIDGHAEIPASVHEDISGIYNVVIVL